MFGLKVSESLSHPVKIGASVIVEKDSSATPVPPPKTLSARNHSNPDAARAIPSIACQ